MTGWHYYVFVTVVARMVIVWCASIIPCFRIAAELRRARKAGEADHIPRAHRGLPAVVIFTKNILPRVEKDRRQFATGITLFVLLWALGMGLALMFSHRQ